MSESAADQPPPRFLLRPAGVLTQLIGAICLLVGTISVVLVIQNKSGGLPLAIAWVVGAMAALVFGGLMARGGLVSVLGGAALDVTFGIALAVLDDESLRSLLRLLPPPDVEMIAGGLTVAAIVMGAVALLCVAAVPQARRYHRALREAEAEAEASGMWLGGEAGQARAMAAALVTTFSGPGGAPTQPPGPGPGPLAATNPAYARGTNPVHAAAPPFGVPPSDRAYAPPGPGPVGGPPPAAYAPPPAASPPMQTNRGWTPNPARTVTTMMLVRPPAEEKRSRRRVYIALGGVAIGLGAGLGVLVASSSTSAQEPVATMSAGSSGSETAAGATPAGTTPDAAVEAADAAAVEVALPTISIRTLLAAQRDAIAKADGRALAELVAPTAFAFGLAAEDVAEGREAIEVLFQKQLADAPPDGFTVTSKFLTTGQEKNHAWTAEELELSVPGEEPRRISITQLATFVDGAWTVVALHWAHPVPDETAERLEILGTLPAPKLVPDRAEGGGDLDRAVRAAFASRTAFVAARSEREDGFNFGSAPGERIVGGSSIKRVFGRLRSELRVNGGTRSVAGAWDPAQQETPWIGFAALNVDYLTKTRAATDLTHTFRVLAVLLREGDEWKLVQTQFSHGGPLR